ncbi:MAG: DUF2085 domain-containing protein [Myxococcales bacterium]|nr:DUF2085 domain-containing protein [Myxococcales bacterium]
MFLLSHHPPEEASRTYACGRVRLCARCLGVYPVALAAIAVQLALSAPLESPLDGPLALLLLPALADWAVGRFRPSWGSNGLRTFTGALLGMAVGRTLFVHFQRPFHAWLLVQAALVTTVALPVILLTYRRRAPR